MKFLKYISVFAAAALLFSCYEDDKTMALPVDEIAAPVMNEMTNIVVDEENLETEVTFSWSGVDYGFSAQVTYSLYANYNDVDYQIGQSYTTSYTLTKENLNNALVNTKGLAVPEYETSTVFFYVVANISSGDAYAKRSNAVQLDITTVKSTAAPWVRRLLYLPGCFQGWAPADAPVLWENGENSNVYEGLVYLGENTDPEAANEFESHKAYFKIATTPAWDKAIGGGDGTLTGDANICEPEGLYWMTVKLDVDKLADGGTYKLTPVECISVIGDAVGGWEPANDVVLTLAGMPDPATKDTDADYRNKYHAAINAQVFSGICEDAVAGDFKYRLNHDWATNWGGDLNHLIQGGGNIANSLTGKVRFSINFRGDIDALAEDMTNPSPISGTVEQAE